MRRWGVPLAIALVFVLLRLPLFFDPALHLGWNADSAVFGFIAKAIARGDGFPVFFWGQSYMGPLTSYLAAPLIWIMHPMRAMRLAASLIVFGGIVFYWLALRRAFSDRVANAAALWLAISPSYMMLFTISTIGGEAMFLLSGIIFWHAQRTGLLRNRDWLILGLLAGFGWWIHQGIVFALGAAILAKFANEIRAVRTFRLSSSLIVRAAMALLVIDLVLGGLVSCGYNVPAIYIRAPMLEPLLALAALILATNMDRFRIPITARGFTQAALFAIGFIVAYSPVIVAMVRGDVHRGYGLSTPGMYFGGVIGHVIELVRHDMWLFAGAAAGVLVIPFFAVAMVRRPALQMPLITIVLAAGFYIFSERAHPGTVRYLVSALPMVYAFAAAEMLRIRGGVLAVIAVAIALLIPRVQQVGDVAAGLGEAYGALPGAFDPRPVVARIERAGYRVCYADYWIAYKLQWVSDERIRFVPYRSFDRNKPASRLAAAEPGRKCFVDGAGTITEYRPSSRDEEIGRKARERLRTLTSAPIIP